MDAAPEDRMLALLGSHPGWHGWKEIAEVCGLGNRDSSHVLALHYRLINRGYRIECKSKPDGLRCRLS